MRVEILLRHKDGSEDASVIEAENVDGKINIPGMVRIAQLDNLEHPEPGPKGTTVWDGQGFKTKDYHYTGVIRGGKRVYSQRKPCL